LNETKGGVILLDGGSIDHFQIKKKKGTGDEWETPWPVFNFFDQKFHFTLDVCARDDSAKCAKYFTKKENSLIQPWHEFGSCWMNPPYSKVGPWLEKAILEAEQGALVAALLPADISTGWYHDLVLGQAHVIQIRGRIRFLEDGKLAKNAPKFGSILAVYSPVHRNIPLPINQNFLTGDDKMKEYLQKVDAVADLRGLMRKARVRKSK
jgi:phage N-6-adenine-methyltransferase